MFTNFASHRPSGIMKSRAARAPKQFKGRTRPNVPLSSKFKTEMCHYLSEQGRCPFGEHCTYAHSKDELRFIERHPKHKTLPCRDFSTEGFCPFGERCSFIHYKSDPEAMWKSLSSSVVTDASEQSAEVDQCSMGQNLRLFHSTDKMMSEKRATMDFLRPPTPSSGYAGSLVSSRSPSPTSYSRTSSRSSSCSDLSDLCSETMLTSSQSNADEPEEKRSIRLPIFRDLSLRGQVSSF
ncbi:protein TIS11 isoform X1 [Galendromus occidentalis]|uniref:Protein TIS11 isoform X1 n=1 Tax=Galendromus occidentalis TaxID=34638 RepID=A0AAJ7L7L2_9ACAR|nr:protein TIS11 isoform X1 [Galendromus occidentalis]